MKIFKTIFAVVAAALTMCLSSCDEFNSVEAPPIIQFGWDMNGDGTLSFDNLNLAWVTNSALCDALDTEIQAQGFTTKMGTAKYTRTNYSVKEKEAKKIVKAIVSKVNPDSYTVSGYNYDFVIGYQFGTDGKFTEVYRKNLYKK